MGNCFQPVDPLSALIPRSTVNVTAIKEATVPIIFLIGGPGAGKTTQCAHIEKHYGFCTIITRELLRDEVATGSQRGRILAYLMSRGKIVPPDVMVQLIEEKMLSKLSATTRGFLVSGFPREKMQCKYFSNHIRPPDLVLYLLVRNSLLIDRIMARTVTTTERHMWSIDENVQKIKTYYERIRPVLKCYKRRIVIIDGEKEEMEVFEDIRNAIDNVLKNFPSSST